MAPQVIKWGIISTGGIATAFSKDLLVDPSTRDADDVAYRIVAIGSRSVPSAQAFLDKLKSAPAEDPCSWGVKQGLLEGCKAYGSYEEVYADPNVDAIYVGTPHTFHHANTKGALLGGKHVLCEKPFTFDLEELDELIAIAKERKLFLMEAVWTRFQPIAYAVQDVIHSGKLGKIKRFSGDLSGFFDADNADVGHRMIAPGLGGGTILDLGPYPAVWAMLVLHRHPENKGRKPKLLSSYQTVYHRTGVDANSRWLLEWEGLAQAHFTTAFDCDGIQEGTCIIQCEKGNLLIDYPPFKPTTFHLVPLPNLSRSAIKEKSTHHYPGHPGGSMHYQADEVARCIRDGKLESERMPLEESRIVQETFDQVRRAGDTVLKNHKGTAGK